MNEDDAFSNTNSFDWLEKMPPYQSDMKITLDGLSADEYIAKLSDEMNAIDLRSIPFDKWDYIVTFSLAMMEVAADFFICDPKFKPSLAHTLSDKNTNLGAWLNGLHEKFGHSAQPLDFQGPGFGGGDHRGNTLGHDLLMFPLALYMLCSGQFIDSTFTKEGVYQWIISQANQNGKLYAQLNVDEAIIAYFTHMLADFCSSRSLPIPGFSLLTHFPDRDVQAFAMKLYKDGLNMRNLLLQGVPVAITELGLWLYTGIRYKESNYSKETIAHKREKLLLIAHGIATAINVGKVIITKNPTSLNLVMIVRTFYLIWKVTTNELNLTHKAILKASMGVLKARIESAQTLILLDKVIYETAHIDRLISRHKETIRCNDETLHGIMNALDSECKRLSSQW